MGAPVRSPLLLVHRPSDVRTTHRSLDRRGLKAICCPARSPPTAVIPNGSDPQSAPAEDPPKQAAEVVAGAKPAAASAGQPSTALLPGTQSDSAPASHI